MKVTRYQLEFNEVIICVVYSFVEEYNIVVVFIFIVVKEYEGSQKDYDENLQDQSSDYLLCGRIIV